jgi:flagellar hook-length control protein FliK
MIKSVNEIAFNKETNVKPRETKSNKGFDKFIKKFSQNKKGDGYLKSAKENTSHVEGVNSETNFQLAPKWL